MDSDSNKKATKTERTKDGDSTPIMDEATNKELGLSEFDSASSSSKQETAHREMFANRAEFILTTLGLAVGIGNILRFPTKAFQHGGSAFLIPYLVVSFVFGLPAVYLELLLGQYQGTSPPIVFRRIMPIIEGVGWVSTVTAATTSVYYTTVISMSALYTINIIRGDVKYWNHCDNSWNKPRFCLELSIQKACLGEDPPGWDENTLRPAHFVNMNGTCHDAKSFKGVPLMLGTEQYLLFQMNKLSTGMMDISGVNWHLFGAMTVVWVVIGLLVWKGIGKAGYATIVLPYALIVALFFRGVTLEGASKGLYYFFLNPDLSKLLSPITWSEALKQLCFSLSLGHGGLMSIASYNKRSNNCFTNAAIIIASDTLMSVIGGAAVFSVLGFLAAQRGVAVEDAVGKSVSLSFVVYPEAFTQMPVPWLWATLFFVVLFLFGLNNETAQVQVFCTCLYDQVPSLRNRKWLVVPLWCLFLYLIGLIFATNAGFYWFEMFTEYVVGFPSLCAITIEIICVMYLYGARNTTADIVNMLGPAGTKFNKFFGSHSLYYLLNWKFVSPLIGIGLIGLSFLRKYPHNGDAKRYPIHFDIIGWSLAFLPLLMIPIFAIRNLIWFKKHGYSLKGTFMLQKQHLSFNRIKNESPQGSIDQTKILPNKEPWAENAGLSMLELPNIEIDFKNVIDNVTTPTQVSVMENPSRRPGGKEDNEDKAVHTEILNELRFQVTGMKKDIGKMKEQIDDIKEDLQMGHMATRSKSIEPPSNETKMRSKNRSSTDLVQNQKITESRSVESKSPDTRSPQRIRKHQK